MKRSTDNLINKIKINKKKLVYNLLGIGFIFVLWLVISNIYQNSLIIPKISEVFSALFNLMKTSRFFELLYKMIIRIILTVSVSLIVALILAMLSFKSNGFYQFLNPLITILKTIPIIAIIIMLLMSIGFDLAPYVATSFVIIPIIYEMVYSSLTQIDSTVTDDLKTLTDNNLNVIVRFYVPLIIPSIITSVVQSFGLGLKVMLMAEYISPRTNTFGAEINRYYMNNQMDYVFAIIIIVVILVFICDKILKLIREKLY